MLTDPGSGSTLRDDACDAGFTCGLSSAGMSYPAQVTSDAAGSYVAADGTANPGAFWLAGPASAPAGTRTSASGSAA